ncbi:MAG: sugar transferase, partial [Oscillospiraceae bacterium]
MTIKRFFKKAEKTTLFGIKVLLFAALFFAFFVSFSFEYPQIMNLSRTAAITMTTFAIVGISMTVVYGGFAIGKKKSKEIISSLGIATFITNVITYFQLCIMNTHSHANPIFTFKNVGTLVLVFLIQMIIISVFVYLANHLYFKINPPENCVVVCDDKAKATEILLKISKYKKQYSVSNVVSYQEDWKPFVHEADSVFIYRVPPKEKDEIIEYAYKHYTNLYINTEVSDIVVNYAKYTMLDDLSVLCSNIKSLSFEQRFIKRALDIVVSSLALIVFSPIMLVEAICVKAYDKGPVLFKQKRATLNSKVF